MFSKFLEAETVKKKFSMLLSWILLVLCAYVPVSANGAEDVEKTQILNSSTYYSYDSAAKTLTVSGSGAVPNFSNSTGASNSQPWALYRSDGSIEHVIVEEGITSLGAYCFYGVSKADISLPSTLKILGSYSMASTYANTDVVLPEGVTTISQNAFYLNSGLKSIYIPSTVTTIGRSAFEGCTALESVTFGHFNMQVSVAQRAFLRCSSLKSVTIPKRASLSDYSVGYYSASSGSVYSDFVMRIYRDSTAASGNNAYDYAISKVISYELICSGEIFEGDSVDGAFYSDSVSSVMTFVFTPEVTAKYMFDSAGDIDIYCRLTETDGTILGESDNVSEFDSNFKLICSLTAGQTYYFHVGSNYFTGDYSVRLMPYTVSDIRMDDEVVTISSEDRVNGYFDVEKYLDGKSISITYDTGFTDSITYASGMTYMDYPVVYSDDQNEGKWICGSHAATVSIGNGTQTIPVEITHNYTCTVVEPTYKDKGYSVYNCSLCGDTYYTDYVNSIGTKITGRIVLMQDTDGSHKDNIPVARTKILVDGAEVCIVENDGTFLFYVDAGAQTLSVCDEYGLTRNIDIIPDSNNEVNLGDIAFFHFDYNGDGYVNAKDFAIIRGCYGKYPNVEADDYLSRDYNQDGKIDNSDWFDIGAENFYTCGKITEEIYEKH